jgi:hypothetical protein
MNQQEKIKITDLASLQSEKQRLKALCELKRRKLETEIDYVKENYPEIGVKAILPFSENINDKIFNAGSWTVKTAKRITGKTPIGLYKMFSGNQSALLKSVLVFAGSRIAKRAFRRKNKPE